MEKILKLRIGSHLYGTNTPTSDEDFSGVILPTENQLFGFERLEQIDESIKSKDKFGKNKKDAIDCVYYELRKFCKLAIDNNPNIIEQLFVNTDNLIFSNTYGQELLKYNYLFPYVGLKTKFLAYAFSQKHKMIIRSDNFYSLENAYEYLTTNINKEDEDYRQKLLIEVLPKNLPFFVLKGNNIQCGDLNFQKHFMIRKVYKMIEDRLSKVTNRKELLLKHGYDCKFASHLIRLMVEGIELLKTGYLQFPLKDKELLLDIKMGKYKITDILNMSDEYEKEINSITDIKVSTIQNYNEIQTIVKNIIKNYYGVKI